LDTLYGFIPVFFYSGRAYFRTPMHLHTVSASTSQSYVDEKDRNLAYNRIAAYLILFCLHLFLSVTGYVPQMRCYVHSNKHYARYGIYFTIFFINPYQSSLDPHSAIYRSCVLFQIVVQLCLPRRNLGTSAVT